ncbi:LANO_0D10902g1_1 [Lachancea nothofagi CBS 11611]|uniref:LANO_0D10902g1_1 n=1 Tax=Lachancea nothofagi CBS 11611 TaxID=1266666 RepID=A0A1G4JKY7_9SACH|nr:LANO_0D10902g1_1 [Lachancea nothofagi CBS 11611]
MPFPKVSIHFCTKCKWNLRSAWYLQELLQTFQDSLAEVSLVPGESGEFRVLGYSAPEGVEITIWDRKTDGGFPDSKFLKQRVKQLLLETSSVGAHLEREAISATLISHRDDETTEHCQDCV